MVSWLRLCTPTAGGVGLIPVEELRCHMMRHTVKKKKWVREERLSRVPWTTKRSKQLILKEINPEYSLEGQMLKLKLQYFGHHNKRSKTWNGVKREQKPVFPNYTNYRRVMREI